MTCILDWLLRYLGPTETKFGHWPVSAVIGWFSLWRENKQSAVPNLLQGNFKTAEVEIWSGPGSPVVKWRSCLLLNDSIQSLEDNAFLMKNILLAHNI